MVDESGGNIDIARTDTDHAGVHIDRFYLPKGTKERKEDYTIQYETPEGAISHFLDENRWRYYFRRYSENHGLPDEARIYEEG